MPALGLAVGQTIGGFRLDECVHVGGMASLWRVCALEGGPARVMKIPLLRYGEDPVAIVSFEVEQMIMPRLVGYQMHCAPQASTCFALYAGTPGYEEPCLGAGRKRSEIRR
jgi:hypothetical protein